MQHEILLRPHEEAYIKEHKLDLKRFHGMDLVFEARMRFLEMPPDERAKLCPGWLEESVAALSGYAGRPTVSWPSIKRRKSDCIRIVTGDTLKSQALAGRFYPAVIRVPSLHIADHRSKKRHYGPQLFRGLKERCRRRRPLLFLKHQLYLCRCLSLNFLGNEYSFKLRLAGDVQIHDATGKPCIQLFEPILSYAVIFQCPTRPAIEDAPAGGASSVASARGDAGEPGEEPAPEPGSAGAENERIERRTGPATFASTNVMSDLEAVQDVRSILEAAGGAN
ncbi:unnamed protein product [Symbiodinium microadriaticum]|nr:unnamed protein product [Symbiodinium microadriaticum]